MSEKTREVPQLAYATYAHTLVIESTHKFHFIYGLFKEILHSVMDRVFMSTFHDQSMSIGCVDKLGHLSGFLRHYILSIDVWCPMYVWWICIISAEMFRLKASYFRKNVYNKHKFKCHV